MIKRVSKTMLFNTSFEYESIRLVEDLAELVKRLELDCGSFHHL